MISERFLKEEQEYQDLLIARTERNFKQPLIFRMVRYLKNIGYADLMEATGLNRGNLHFILNNPYEHDHESQIREIHEVVKKKYNLRGCYLPNSEAIDE